MEELKSEYTDIKAIQEKLILRHKQFLLERDMNTNKHILICGYVEKLNESEAEINRCKAQAKENLEHTQVARDRAEEAERQMAEHELKLRTTQASKGKLLIRLALTVRVLQMIHRIQQEDLRNAATSQIMKKVSEEMSSYF